MEKRKVLICMMAFCLLLNLISPIGFINSGHAESKGAVNINTASLDELVQLPRVGEKVAARIILYRKEHGSFKSVEDLKTVKGIGGKIFQKIRPLVRVK